MFFAKTLIKKYLSFTKVFANNKNYYQLKVSEMHLSQLHAKIGITSLNNDPLNFEKNFNNIMKSIQMCKDLGCSIRVGS